MSKTKKLTLSSLMVAMGIAIMALGSFIEVMDLTVCAAVSLIVVFIYLEVGVGYAWGVILFALFWVKSLTNKKSS